jgi:DNA-directed RNA polymerase
MSSNKTKSSGVGGGQPSKKSKGPLATFFTSGTKEQVLESMISRYKGRRILLKAQDIYGRGKVPSGEEEYLFQYIIDSINEDCKTAILKYEDSRTTLTPQEPRVLFRTTTYLLSRKIMSCTMLTMVGRIRY